MAIQKIEVEFKDRFIGEMTTKRATAAVGGGDGRLAPYDMLLGALATCLYSTFLDVIEKKRITFDKTNMIVTGEKRESIPMTLKWVNVIIEIQNPSNEKGVNKAAELAAKYCSVYETISKVAKISLEVRFV